MDNKLFKRIVAVAASAVMLTSSVLATELTVGEDAWNDTAKSLTFSYDPAGATKVTYLAYAAREATAEELADENFKADYTDTTNSTKYVFGEIVAVNQIDSASGALAADTLSVPVNGDLLVVGEDAATNIVLMSGSDIATTADVKVVPTTTQAPVTYAVTIVANDGVVVTEGDVIPANGNYSEITLPVLKKDGFVFNGWSTDGTAAGIIENSATANQTVTVSAATTYTAIFEAVAPAVTVTFMNGAETVATLTAVDGKVTAPAAVTKASAASTITESGKVDFTFYKWTTEDGTTDYDANSSIAVTEDITLYAKYDTGLLNGDVDNTGTITTTDYGQVKLAYRGRSTTFNVGSPIYEGSSILNGDVDNTGTITTTDYGQVKLAYRGRSTTFSVGSPIYVINK